MGIRGRVRWVSKGNSLPNTDVAVVFRSELASMSAIVQTEDERSESEVASEIGHSQSTEQAIACSVTVIALRNPANPPSDTHAL